MSPEYRVTPSSRGTGQAAVSRPPWATELDDGGAGYSPAPAGRPSSASRQRPAADARSGHEDFSFATPSSRAAGGFAGQGGGGGGQADQLDVWTQQQAHAHAHQHAHQHHHQPRPSSGSAGAGPDAGLYARLDHSTEAHGPGPGAAAPGQGASPLGRRVGSVGTGGGVARLQGGSMGGADGTAGAAPTPGRTGSGRVGAGAGAAGAVPPATSGAARASGRPPHGGGAPGAAASSSAAAPHGRVGASPARGAAATRAGPAAGSGGGASTSAAPGPRSTSTPRPRPSLPPKRTTSDSPRRADWADAAEPTPSGRVGGGGGGAAPRRPGAGAGARAVVGRGGSAGAAEGRWDAGDNDADRGSWLFAGEPDAAEAAPSGKAAAPAARGGGAGGAAAGRRPVPAPAPVNEWDEVPVGGARARQAALEAEASVDSQSHEPSAPSERRQHRAQAQSDWDTSLAEDESGRPGGRGAGSGAGGRSLGGEEDFAGGGRVSRPAGSSGADWGDEGEARHGCHTGPTSFGRRAAKPHGSPGPVAAAAASGSPAAAVTTSGGEMGGLEATFSSHPSPAAASFTFGGLASGGLGHGLAAGEAAPRGPSRGGSGGGLSGGGGAGRALAGSAAAADSKQLQALQEENARLREQVEHLQRLAAAAAAGGGGGGGGGPEATASGRRAAGAAAGAAQRPHSASAAEGQRGAAAALAAANAAGVGLQQYKSQVIQLQRQVALMSREMEAKSRIAAEAEGALLATAERLQELVAATAPGAASDDAAPLGRDHLAQLHKWSKQMLGRLKSEKSQSARLFSRQDLADSIARAGRGGGGGAGGGGGGLSPSWGDSSSTGAGGGAGGAPAQTWQVPFIAAGGNRFLLAAAAAASAADDGGGGMAAAAPPPPGPSVAAIASGQAALLADPLLAHRLELQLAAVAPKLAAVAVLLKTQLLPAMPWLSMEASDRLQAETSEAAESVAQAAEGLVQLCSLLPAGAAVFGDAAVAAEPKRRAAEVEAGRDAWLYGSPELLGAPPEQPMVDEAGLAALTPLLRDRKAGGRGLCDVLEPLRAAAAAGAAKRAVLEAELRFAARAGGLAAEHVAHLMMSVGMALEDVRAATAAKDAAAIKSYFGAAAAVRQVLQAADSLEVHPCETCLKALVEQVRAHREWLDRLPDLLVSAPAADVEGRLLVKVEELHQGFRKALGKLDAHKRRALDAHARRAGGDAAAEDEDAEGGTYEEDWEDEEGARAGEGGGSRRLQQGGSGSGGTGAGTGAARAAVAKPPKPAPPRREWQE
ncbi:hypothetical protein HXX76_011386 [Chlamydomonas incerta]|uniref:Uncharacterized protein n=1 Tax=Chlamydomonas incerta TaxID=51695 RepID=A0A835VXH3_CHLIN|nr:hypothetical protein HXX76_011386 [Chlamydomonas incerta]|eukprot:KAG2428681.1 hypothetical protein HXX76_011386 [Chlamydomonas incerta]